MHFKLELSNLWSNFEFDRNTVNGTGARRCWKIRSYGRCAKRSHVNRAVSQNPKCTRATSHNAPLCSRNVHMCAHFCYKMVHCGICVKCIVGISEWIYCIRIDTFLKCRVVVDEIENSLLFIANHCFVRWYNTIWILSLRPSALGQVSYGGVQPRGPNLYLILRKAGLLKHNLF